jgi:hypothetical protein
MIAKTFDRQGAYVTTGRSYTYDRLSEIFRINQKNS